jgi:hypothetical protein
MPADAATAARFLSSQADSGLKTSTIGRRAAAIAYHHRCVRGRQVLGSLSGPWIAAIVKRYALAAGLDPAAFAGHSLRSGFLTSSAEAGASVLKMVEVSRHKSVDMLVGYVRRSNLFREHAGAAFL